MEREKGLEPFTLCLGSKRSTDPVRRYHDQVIVSIGETLLLVLLPREVLYVADPVRARNWLAVSGPEDHCENGIEHSLPLENLASALLDALRVSGEFGSGDDDLSGVLVAASGCL